MRLAATLLLFLALLINSYGANLAPTPAPLPHSQPGIRSGQFDQQIDTELTRKEYQWHLPADSKIDNDPPFADFFRWVGASSRAALETVRRWWDALQSFLDHLNPKGESNESLPDPTPHNISSYLWVALILLGLTILALAVVLFLRLRKPQRAGKGVSSPAAAPDLESDTVSAADLPENEWWALANEKLNAGEIRLALRAYFLALLAALADRELINLKRSRSNSDYEIQLRRRQQAGSGLVQRFVVCRLAFERTWYGDYPVSLTDVEALRLAYAEVRGTKDALLASKLK
jgi:hypothetical protein